MQRLFLALTGIAGLAFASLGQAADVAGKSPAATPAMSGYAGLYGGGTWSSYWVDGTQYRASSGIGGGEARLNQWLSPGLALQLDLEGEGTGGVLLSGEARNYAIIGGHLALRDPARQAFGLFGGGLYTNSLGGEGRMSYAFGGVEAQAYLGQITLYGQIGLAQRISGVADDQLKNGWFIHGEARYFATPNDKLTLEGGYIRGPGETGSGITKAANWGATFEHRLSGPISLFASYQGFWFDDIPICQAGVATENLALVGIRFYLKENSLAHNDRNGATWDMAKLRSLSWGDVANETHCQ